MLDGTASHHGGARPGAGRKRLSPRKRGRKIQVYLSAEAWTRVSQIMRAKDWGLSQTITALVNEGVQTK